MQNRSLALAVCAGAMLAGCSAAAASGGSLPVGSGSPGGASRSSSNHVSFCRAEHLKGSFSEIRGSAGAGNVVYRLRLKNTGPSACDVTGIPGMRLLGRYGRPLPTHVSKAFPGSGAAVLVRLSQGASAWLSARFSGDVPGSGEPVNRACEATAYLLRVTSSWMGGRVTVPISPPTPVCEHGAMSLSTLSSKRPTA